jgi:hypothetical protein
MTAMNHSRSTHFAAAKHAPTSPRPQFNLATLLGVTTGLCVLFAILSTLGVPPVAMLVGFTVMGAVAAAVIGIVEACSAIARWRQTNCHHDYDGDWQRIDTRRRAKSHTRCGIREFDPASSRIEHL